MKKLLFLPLLPVAFLATAFIADTCGFGLAEGTIMTTTSYNDKNKIVSVATTTIKTVTSSEASETVGMSTVFADSKGKTQHNLESSMSCSGGKVVMDLRNLISPELTDGPYNAIVTLEGRTIDFPLGLTAGSTLPDATLIVHFTKEDTEVATTTVKIHNRKVEAEESKTTPAGAYSCLKIVSTREVTKKIGEMGRAKSATVVEWFSYEVGVVRTEIYEDAVLENYSELTALKKP